MPSSRVHTWATAAALPSLSANPGSASRRDRQRAERLRTPSGYPGWPLLECRGRREGGLLSVHSPPTPSGSRLVARRRRLGQAARSTLASTAHASMRCSQLSRTSNVRRSHRNSIRESSTERPGADSTPRTLATVSATSSALESGARSTRKSSARTRAVSSASRVLPDPPAPVSVTSRCSRSRRLTRLLPRSRPMKLVSP